MHSEIRSLIDRLERANSPDAELDREIARVVRGEESADPPYTSSFDAARTLIPPGIDVWTLSAAGGVAMMQMHVMSFADGFTVSGRSAADRGAEAIATVICCLEAILLRAPARSRATPESRAASHQR